MTSDDKVNSTISAHKETSRIQKHRNFIQPEIIGIPGNIDVYDIAIQQLSDHCSLINKSHEAYLDFEDSTMKNASEMIFSKLALGRGEEVGKNQHPQKSNETKELYTWEQITEFATGSLVKCFGDHYSIYEGRRSPRTPNGDLQLISRVLEVNGTRGDFKNGGSLVSEYDVPADAWFYRQNSSPVMPYSIYMEIALQPCGFLATYMGCTLIYPDIELCFRNLDSTATMLKEVDLRNRTITATSKLITVASSAETVIVRFDYELILDGDTFFKGDTSFGYFTPRSLANQVGLDKGENAPPWYVKNDLAASTAINIDLKSQEARNIYYTASPEKPFFKQAGGQLDFLEKILIFEQGGDYGLGYVYSEKEIDPDDWFFPFHFFQDPVMPGSLGVEAILQSLRLFALQQNLGSGFKSPCFTNAVSQVTWNYRGQIIKTDKLMSIEAHIKNIEKLTDRIVITADASLWKNGLRIYRVMDAAIAIVEMR